MLSIRKGAPEYADPGASIAYTLRVENVGGVRASSLTVTDTLPGGAFFQSSDGVYNAGPPPFVQWQADRLDPGQVLTFGFVVTATTTLVNAEYAVALPDGSAWPGDPTVTIVSNRITTGTVNLEEGGVVSTENLELSFPADAGAQSLTVTVVQPERLLNEGGFAGVVFGVETVGSDGSQVTRFDEPLTLTVRYEDSDWQDAGIDNEGMLNLYVFREDVWQAVLPCAGCSHDRDRNTFTARLDHLSLFALRSQPESSYLPLLGR